MLSTIDWNSEFQISDKVALHYEGNRLALYNVSRHGGKIFCNKVEEDIIVTLNKLHALTLIWENMRAAYHIPDDDQHARSIFETYIGRLLTKNLLEHGNTESPIYGIKGKFYPLYASVEFTDQCNFNCSHCYKEASISNRKFLSKEICQVFSESCVPFLYSIDVTGGEPTLHPQFEELVSLLRVPVLNLATNGSKIRDISDYTLSKFSQIQISLYGANEDDYKTNTGNDAFDDVLNGLSHLHDLGVYTTIAVILRKDSFDKIEEYFKIANRVNASSLRFGASLKLGRNKTTATTKWDLTGDDCVAFKKKIDELREEFPLLDVESIDEADSDIEIPPSDGSEKIVCGAGIDSICVSEQGIVRPCIMFPDKHFGRYQLNEYIATIESGQMPIYTECIKSCVAELKSRGRDIKSICPHGFA